MTLLNSVNSNRGWCRVWMQSTIQFSIISKKLPANIIFRHDSARLSGVKGEQDGALHRVEEVHTSKVFLQRMTGLLWHAGFCQSGMNKTSDEQYVKCPPHHTVMSGEFHGQICWMQHWGAREREAPYHYHLHYTSLGAQSTAVSKLNPGWYADWNLPRRAC